MLFKIAIIETPKLRAGGADQKIETTAVRQLIVALVRFGAGDGGDKQGSREGIVLARDEYQYPRIYPHCSWLVPNSPVFEWTIITQNLADFSHFTNVSGRPWNERWCQERTPIHAHLWLNSATFCEDLLLDTLSDTLRNYLGQVRVLDAAESPYRSRVGCCHADACAPLAPPGPSRHCISTWLSKTGGECSIRGNERARWRLSAGSR